MAQFGHPAFRRCGINGIELPFVGNLTRDPEIRFTTGGRAVASTSVAVSRRYQTNGEWQEQTTFLNLVIWGALGEHVAESLAKGTRVVGCGRLEQRAWETQEGEKRSVMEVIVDAIGPDLRWAKAEVEKVQRDQGDRESAPPSSGGGGGGGGDSYPNPEEPYVRDATVEDL